jgi:peptidyl-prolyl cis-trans isomerase B (cyclophilin B)
MTFLKNSKLYCVLLLGIFIFAAACSSPSTPSTSSTSTPSSASPASPAITVSPDEEIALIETDFGKFKIKFFPDVAPKHVENFKKLASEGFYNGLAFHRVIPDGIIQGGDPTTRGNNRELWGMGQPGQPTVPAEFNNRPFIRGTVGAARTNDPNSASSQFFICLKEMPQWNGNYTVFGHVIEGLNTVQVISNAPRDPATIGSSDKVRDKVVIRRVTLEKAGAQSKG